MKHRNKSKIKTEHGMIEGLGKYLQKVEQQIGVKAIFPGTIRITKKHVPGFQFRIQRQTDKGYKCVARNGKRIQEVYIIGDLEI